MSTNANDNTVATASGILAQQLGSLQSKASSTYTIAGPFGGSAGLYQANPMQAWPILGGQWYGGNTFNTFQKDAYASLESPLWKAFQDSLQRNQPVQSNNTIRVIESTGASKDFTLADEKENEEAATEYASERADATRAKVYLLRPFAVVTPERKTKVTKL